MTQMQRLARQHRVTVANLSIKSTYATPSGRLCKLLPNSDCGRDIDSFSFYYLDEPLVRPINNIAKREGFRLSSANIGLLREVVR